MKKEIYSHGFQALGFKSYQDYLNSELWKEKRSYFLYSHGEYCDGCNISKKEIYYIKFNNKIHIITITNSLQVHHINYFNVGNEHQEDLKILCMSCHQKIHNNIDKNEET